LLNPEKLTGPGGGALLFRQNTQVDGFQFIEFLWSSLAQSLSLVLVEIVAFRSW
jgi:hypothetical protein